MKHRLGNDRKGDDGAKLQAGDRDHRHERVLQRMTEVNRPVGQPARTRELDVVGAQHFQHLGAHQPHDQRHLEQRKRDRRQDQRFESAFGEQACRPPAQRNGFAAAERRQPAQNDRENQDQQNADEKGRQRDADQRYRKQNLREKRMSSQRGVHACRNADDQREKRRGERKLQRRRKPLLEQRRHRPSLAKG